MAEVRWQRFSVLGKHAQLCFVKEGGRAELREVFLLLGGGGGGGGGCLGCLTSILCVLFVFFVFFDSSRKTSLKFGFNAEGVLSDRFLAKEAVHKEETVNGGGPDGMNFDGRPRRRHGQGRGVGTFCWERGVALGGVDHAWMCG